MLTTDVRRDAADRDFFYEPALQFGIGKPFGWRFLPASARADGISSRAPFLTMVQEIAGDQHARPTIQACCRPLDDLAHDELRGLLGAQLSRLRRKLPGFELLASSCDNIIGGYRAAHLQFHYTLCLPSETGLRTMPVLVHNYLLPTPGLVFTLAMSSSPDPLYYDEGDFAAALSSLRIGAPDARLPDPTVDRPRVVGLRGSRRARTAAS